MAVPLSIFLCVSLCLSHRSPALGGQLVHNESQGNQRSAVILQSSLGSIPVFELHTRVGILRPRRALVEITQGCRQVHVHFDVKTPKRTSKWKWPHAGQTGNHQRNTPSLGFSQQEQLQPANGGTVAQNTKLCTKPCTSRSENGRTKKNMC